MTSSTRRWRTVRPSPVSRSGRLGHAHGVPFVGSSDRVVTLGVGPVSVVAGEVCGVRKDYAVRTQLPNTCSMRVSTSSNIRATTRTDVLSNMCSPVQEQGEVTMSAIVLEAVRQPHTEEPARSQSTGRPRLVLVPTGPEAARAARAARPPMRLTRFGRLVVTLLVAGVVSVLGVGLAGQARVGHGRATHDHGPVRPDPVGHRRPRACPSLTTAEGVVEPPDRQRPQHHSDPQRPAGSSSRVADPSSPSSPSRARPVSSAVCSAAPVPALLIRRVGSTFSGWR